MIGKGAPRARAPLPQLSPQMEHLSSGWGGPGGTFRTLCQGAPNWNDPLGARDGWELANGPHTGRPPPSAQNLPVFAGLCSTAKSPLPQGHILTLKGEGRPIGESQHVKEPETVKKTGQESRRGAWQRQGANERWERNTGKAGVQVCRLQHLGRALSQQ